MKKIFILIAACCVVFIACNNSDDADSPNRTNSNGTKTEKKISSIDPSITPANSYSDLFF